MLLQSNYDFKKGNCPLDNYKDVTRALLPGAPSHNISLSCAFFLPSSSSIPVKLLHRHGNRLNSEAVWVKHHSSDIYYQPLRLYGLMMGNHQCCDLWVERRACVNVDCSDSGDINASTQQRRVNAARQQQFKGVLLISSSVALVWESTGVA